MNPYQSAMTAPWLAYAPAPTLQRTSGWGDYFRGLSLVAWMFCLVVSFWWLREWDDIFRMRDSGFDKQTQYLGAAIAMVAHLTIGLSAIANTTIEFFKSVKGRCLGGFCVLMLALSPLSITPLNSAIYALATLGVFMVGALMWQGDYTRLRRVMFLVGAVLLGFMFLLLVSHGLSKTSIGGIQRNRVGQAALTGVICLFIFGGRIKWLGLAAGIALALLVNSRGTLLAYGAFAATYFTMKHGLGRGVLIAMAMAAVGTVFIAIPRLGNQASERIVNDVAKLNDRERGVGSGLTGRLVTWEEGLRVFAKSPAIGHGFRTRDAAGTGNSYFAHSGYINLLADTGIVGATLVLGALVYDFFKRWTSVRHARAQLQQNVQTPGLKESLDLNSVICAFLMAEAALWLIEPLYLNLGATLSILFILLVMAPYAVAVKTRWPAYAYYPTLYPNA